MTIQSDNGLFSVDEPQQPDPGFLWKALGYVGRPASAITGAVTATLEGRDPIGAASRGWSGEQHYGGVDLLKAIGVPDPEHALGGWAAPIADVLNPLDPLLYVGGLGALTKTGRAAEAIGTLSKGAEAFGAAERSLLPTFMGRSLGEIIPGVASAEQGAVSGMGNAAAMLHLTDNPLANFAKKTFSVPGALDAAGIAPDVAETMQRARTAGEELSNLHMAQTDPFLQTLSKLDQTRNIPSFSGDAGNVSAREATSQIYDQVKAGLLSPQQAVATLHAQPDLWKAHNAIQGLNNQYLTSAQDLATSSGTPLSSLAKMIQGENATAGASFHLPHIASEAQGDLAPITGTTENALRELSGPLKGTQADNYINRSLHAGSEQSILSENYLNTPEEIANATDATQLLRKPAYMAPGEVQDAASRAEFLRKQQAEQLSATKLVDQTVQDGVAEPWTDKHDGDLNWIKVDGGPYKDNPIAIPKPIDQALQKYDQVTSAPTTAIFGNFVNKVMQLWKTSVLATPGRIVRNFIQGEVRNAEEGLGFLPNQLAHTMDMNIKAVGGVTRAGMMVKNGLSPLEDTTPLALGGRNDLTWGDVWRQWETKRLHGAQPGEIGVHNVGMVQSELADTGPAATGGLVGKALDAIRTPSWKNPFHLLTQANGKVEELLRMPLALHAMDETLRALPEGTPLTQAMEIAGNHARDRVLTAHFDYAPQAYTSTEQAVNRWYIPFYKWYKNNVPYEFKNMIQHPGQYMPLARAYYNAYQNQGSAPEDTPEWLRNDYAIPLNPDAQGQARFLDPAYDLPQMDALNILGSMFGAIPPKSDRANQIGQYAVGMVNPFAKFAAEQALNRNSFTGGELANKPAEFMGVPTNRRINSAIQLGAAPLAWLDRLNPGGVFNAVGAETGAVPEGGRRQGQNAPLSGVDRALRALGGIKVYTPDPDEANKTRKEVERTVQQYAGIARRIRLQGGAEADARFYDNLAEDARSKL